jgi:hypothetical protein
MFIMRFLFLLFLIFFCVFLPSYLTNPRETSEVISSTLKAVEKAFIDDKSQAQSNSIGQDNNEPPFITEYSPSRGWHTSPNPNYRRSQ